jgi:hypothetical protein
MQNANARNAGRRKGWFPAAQESSQRRVPIMAGITGVCVGAFALLRFACYHGTSRPLTAQDNST